MCILTVNRCTLAVDCIVYIIYTYIHTQVLAHYEHNIKKLMLAAI